MKKIISFLLVFIFSFTLISSSREKESKAVGTLVAGYTISQILGSLALSATVVGAGYAVADTLVEPEDNSQFTDFLQQVFKQTLDLKKYEVPPPPEPLGTLESVTLLSMLTKQGIEVGTDLYNKVFEFFNSETDEELDYTINPYLIITGPDSVLRFGGQYNHSSFYIENGNIKTNYDSLRTIYDLDGNIINSSKWINRYANLYPVSSIISITGTAKIYTDNTNTTLSPWSPEIFNQPTPIPSFLSKPDNMEDPDNYIPVFKNIDLSPLNGLVKSPQELIDIINGVKEVPSYIYGKITTAFNEIYDNFLENPNFIGADTPLTPTLDPSTGNLIYGDPLPDEPLIDDPEIPDSELSFWGNVLYWLKGIWQGIRDLPGNIGNSISNSFQWLRNWINTFWTNVNTLIDDFWMSFTDWWQDNFIYHWTTFQNWIQGIWEGIPGNDLNFIQEALLPLLDIPALLNNVWQWLQGLPDLIYSWFIPEPELIQDTWQPVIDLWNDKIDPVLAPFENLAFYEEELQDVSVNLKFGSYQGTHKIIDYQYVKSVKDSVKSIIRAFFWILIIFFNLDQVHRLIRNQSIINAYVRKIDSPKGRD